MGRRIGIIDKQALVERMECFVIAGKIEQCSPPVELNLGILRIDLKGMIECIDGLGKFLQVLVGPSFIVTGMEIMGIIQKCSVEISNSIAEAAEVI